MLECMTSNGMAEATYQSAKAALKVAIDAVPAPVRSGCGNTQLFSRLANNNRNNAADRLGYQQT